MDQRLSVRDQLEQGVRVLDFEVAALEGKWLCAPNASNSGAACQQRARLGLPVQCFSDCPFIVSHGSVEESVGLGQGYTFPEALFAQVLAWVQQNPLEIVTLVLIATHGNKAPANEAVRRRLNTTGLLAHVWNHDPSAAPLGPGSFPTLGAMRRAGRTVLLAQAYGSGWGPSFSGSLSNSSGLPGCGAPSSVEGWDSTSFFQLAPQRAMLGARPPPNGSLFAIENLSSRRGRAEGSCAYWPLPNELADAPFQFGGNPAQGALAANYSHVRALEARFAQLLRPHGVVPTWLLVDFFNTSTPQAATPSRTLLPNPREGLIDAVRDINRERLVAWRRERERAAAPRA